MGKQPTTKKQTIEQVKEAHEIKLMAIDGVQGVGIGQRKDADGLAITIYVESKTKALRETLPKELEGYPVQVEVSGEFHAF